MKNVIFKINKKYLTWVVLLLIFIVSILVISPFITAIISAYVLSFLILPLFKFFNKRMSKNLSALLCVLVLVLLVVIPLFFIVNQFVVEASVISRNFNVSESNFTGSLEILNIKEVQSQALNIFSGIFSKIFNSLPSMVLALFVTFFGVFYFLYDWEKINSFIYKKIPFENKKILFDEIGSTTKKITYGLLLIGTIEFTIALIGFTISGVKFPLLLSLLIGFLAFTLFLDASIVWGPVAFVYFFVLNNPATALGVIITGLILSTDTIFRPKIMGSVSKMNPFLMLLGVLGGIALFGFLGFIIGPVVLFFSLRLFQESFEIE